MIDVEGAADDFKTAMVTACSAYSWSRTHDYGVEMLDEIVACVVFATKGGLRLSESETGGEPTEDFDIAVRVSCKGLGTDDRSDTLGDALAAIRTAIVALSAPGAWMGNHGIEELVGLDWMKTSPETGYVTSTWRVM